MMALNEMVVQLIPIWPKRQMGALGEALVFLSLLGERSRMTPPTILGWPTTRAEVIPLFPEGNWPLMETTEEMKERKRRRDVIHKEIGEQSCER